MNRRRFLAESVRLGGAATLSTLAPHSVWADASVLPPRSSGDEPSSRVARGPLRVLDANPRFFTDGSGKAIYLAGSHTWWNFQDNGHRLISAEGQDPPPVFDFKAYLDFLAAHHHNFFRLWRWEAPKWGDDQPSGAIKYCQPHPWVRSGPDLARDGKPKFDLTRFNPEYFDRMRTRITAARDRGIYVSIMLFEGWELQYTDSWICHPFNGPNNINGIDPEPDGAGRLAPEVTHRPTSAGEDIEGLKTAHYGGMGYVGAGLTYNTLQRTSMGKRVLALQEAYLRKVAETVSDLDNVLYETCNEAGPYSIEWQYHLINYLHEYEGGKEKQHPVGMTFPLGATNEVLYRSPADWISPNPGSSEENYLAEPSSAYHGKVIVDDTDHLCGHTCGDTLWVWKCFCHGLNVLIMEDLSPSPTWQDSARDAMGQVRKFSERVNLAQMVPVDKLSETHYCLANAGREYLVFQPGNKGEFALNLSDAPGTFTVEWLNASTGTSVAGKPVQGGGVRTFPTPFGGPGVLYLKVVG
jgi:hypothetical protein